MPRKDGALGLNYEPGALARPHYDEKVHLVVEELVEDALADREQAIEELSQTPHETLVAEFDVMMQLYRDRAVDYNLMDGSRAVAFATRWWNEAEQKYELDDHYSVSQLHDGTLIYRMKVMPVIDSGYEVIFTDEDILSARVLVDSYAIPLIPDNYPRVCKDVLEHTLATAHIVNERQRKYPETAAYAHENARDLLEIELGL